MHAETSFHRTAGLRAAARPAWPRGVACPRGVADPRGVACPPANINPTTNRMG